MSTAKSAQRSQHRAKFGAAAKACGGQGLKAKQFQTCVKQKMSSGDESAAKKKQ